MVAYSFQRRFLGPIRAGTKRQTIRAERKRHARPGEPVQLYVGMRTKHCRLIAAPTCESVWPVRLDFDLATIEHGNGRVFDESDLDPFAVSDGFADWEDMRAFWERQHPGVRVFSGLLIRWTPIVLTDHVEADARGGQMDLFPEAHA